MEVNEHGDSKCIASVKQHLYKVWLPLLVSLSQLRNFPLIRLIFAEFIWILTSMLILIVLAEIQIYSGQQQMTIQEYRPITGLEIFEITFKRELGKRTSWFDEKNKKRLSCINWFYFLENLMMIGTCQSPFLIINKICPMRSNRFIFLHYLALPFMFGEATWITKNPCK